MCIRDRAGSPANRSGLDPSTIFNVVVRSLQRWKAASGSAATFDYWQGNDRGTFEPNSDYNGLSSLYFSSNADEGSRLSSNVLGLTQVWYATDTGEILEADIILNDVDYRFTTNPHDTSGFGGGGSGMGSNVFIENVLTHEFGHAFGLSHSGGLQSTMLFMESPEQAFLGCDEQIAIRSFYPTNDAGSRGGISGLVRGPTGQGIFGAHVIAVSRRRGVALATAITDSIGRYTISGLEPGSYFLIAEPYFAGASALPSYYAGINPLVCNGAPFGRTVLTGSNGTLPSPVQVPTGGIASAPALSVLCNASGGGATVTSNPAAASISTAPVIYSGNGNPVAGGFGASDRFSTSNTLYYRITNVTGRVEVHALSYSLYSPIEPVVALLDSSGQVVASQKADNIYTGSSGYVNYDSALIASDLPPGDYTVRVTAKTSLGASSYPAGPLALDPVPFMLVTGSINEAGPALAASLPVNGRCRMEENFSSYSSPSSTPDRRALQEEETIGFCGTVAALAAKNGGRGGDGPRGPSAGAIAGWFLPWAVMALTVRAMRSRRLRPAFAGQA
mgnify:CR=1 FL=1